MNTLTWIYNDINSTSQLNEYSVISSQNHPYKIERDNSNSIEALGVLKFLKIAHGVGVKF